MTPDSAAAFATAWIEAWNRRDAEAVLAHYTEDLTFVSPLAAVVAGTPQVVGKAALRAYWNAALARIARLRFTLDHALWDDGAQILAVVYVSEADGARRRCCEVMRFDPAGRVFHGEAFHGIEAAS
jgi:ketosteroid isomerase-like protein